MGSLSQSEESVCDREDVESVGGVRWILTVLGPFCNDFAGMDGVHMSTEWYGHFGDVSARFVSKPRSVVSKTRSVIFRARSDCGLSGKYHPESARTIACMNGLTLKSDCSESRKSFIQSRSSRLVRIYGDQTGWCRP